MSSRMLKIFLSLFVISSIFSLKLQLIDEDYVLVQIGLPPKPYKLFVDPMGSFTYLFKPLNSTSTLPGESDQLEFTNVLGKFKGIWKNDFIYLTDDRLMNFRMDFLEITEKDTKFQCDGVLGLGYSFSQSYGNIYDVLAKMYNVFR